MTCDKCPNLKKQNGNYFCTHFVTENGEQILSKHTLEIKVMTKSKPRYCEVDDNGKEIDDELHR